MDDQSALSPTSSSSADTAYLTETDMPTEDLLFMYLQHHRDVRVELPSPTSEDAVFPPLYSSSGSSSTPLDTASVIRAPSNIQLQLNSFSELLAALNDIGHQQMINNPFHPFGMVPTPSQLHVLDVPHTDNNGKWSTEEEAMYVQSTDLSVPSSIRLDVESSQMLDDLMGRAVTHWCCIGFKVAPISLETIRDWRSAPPAIVYCVASISLVTFMDHQAGQAFVKQAAMVFYEQARRKMDDVFLDDMHPSAIQAYFCLSYTSNLLRLYEQQRTWGGLASIALQQHAKDIAAGQPVDRLTMMCWLRWYYVDAWMCLTLNRECLLDDDTPLTRVPVARQDIEHPAFRELYQLASLTRYMRMYIRAISSGHMFSDGVGGRQPSALYHSITQQLKAWYESTQHNEDVGSTATTSEVHFHLCYHSVRLIILFQFLHPTLGAPRDILIDCLETNLALLQALRHLKDKGCDQSTYHHMFFAIHNTAKRIFGFQGATGLHSLAEEQLRMNLLLLRGTQAYLNDVFKMRFYAEKIQEQFRDLNITETTELPSSAGAPLSLQAALAHHAPSTAPGPRIFVFRQHQDMKRKSRSNKSLKTTTTHSACSQSTPCMHYARQSNYAKKAAASSSVTQHTSSASTGATLRCQQRQAQIV